MSGLEAVSAEDVEEHIFELFVERKNENPDGLGWLARGDEVEITIADKYDLTVRQSMSLLNSKQESSTTGAVAWRVSPRFCEWLLAEGSLFHNVFSSTDTVVVELGAGVAGILASVVGPRVGKYVVTDQMHLLKLLRINIDNNLVPAGASGSTPKGRRKGRSQTPPTPQSPSSVGMVTVEEFDWEKPETLGYFDAHIRDVGPRGVIVACDTVYNDFLIPHFCAAVDLVLRTMGPGSRLIMAQQLRSEEVLQSCLEHLISLGLALCSVDSDHLSPALRDGFAVHVATRP